MSTRRIEVSTLVIVLFLVLTGHLCPGPADIAPGPLVEAFHGGAPVENGHDDHHDTHLSTCAPPALLAGRSAPGVTGGATGAFAIVVSAILEGPVGPFFRSPRDARLFRPLLFLLHAALLI